MPCSSRPRPAGPISGPWTTCATPGPSPCRPRPGGCSARPTPPWATPGPPTPWSRGRSGRRGAQQTGGNLSSPLRDKALFLSALLDAAPSDPRLGSLAVEVGRLLEGEPTPSTRENAFALLALGKFYARQAGQKTLLGPALRRHGPAVGFFSDKALSLRGLPQAGDLRIRRGGGLRTRGLLL